jgi:hypothetical protein
VQELLITAKWHFVVPDYNAIEVLPGIHRDTSVRLCAKEICFGS